MFIGENYFQTLESVGENYFQTLESVESKGAIPCFVLFL